MPIARAVTKVLIKGAGEHASGTAHRLWRAGFAVAMTEIAHPTAVRRSVAFCSAVYEGEVVVEGVRAVGYGEDLEPVCNQSSLDEALAGAGFIPVVVDLTGTLRERWRPDVIVDGRIAKRNLDCRLDDAPLVIGLGPGLEAGQDVHVAIETQRGHDLGRIISSGFASPNTGTPGVIAGVSHQRVLRAPAAGILEARRDIGDSLEAGEIVATVALHPVRAETSGVLRGLSHPGLEVRPGQKIGDIDPRGDRAACWTLSDKTRTISGSVLEAILAAGFLPCAGVRTGSSPT